MGTGVSYFWLIFGVVGLAFAIAFSVRRFNIWKRRKADAAVCKELAEKAHQRLRDFVPTGTYSISIDDYKAMEARAIDSALDKREKYLLEAYANLIGDSHSMMIWLTVYMIDYVRIENPSTPIGSKPLTAEQVQVYHELRNAADTDGQSVINLGNNACRVGYYALENMDDAHLILSVVQGRKVTAIDEVKRIVEEIKNSPSTALAEGAL